MERESLYCSKTFFVFYQKTNIQIHIQTCLYTYMRINIYSNKFINIYIPIHTSSEYVPPPRQRGQRWLLYVYTKTHLATSNDHVGNSSPQGQPCAILRTPCPGITSAVDQQCYRNVKAPPPSLKEIKSCFFVFPPKCWLFS